MVSEVTLRSAPVPATVLEETVAPETRASVTTFVNDSGVLNAPDDVTVPMGEVSATAFLSIKRPKNSGLVLPNPLIATSSPASFVRINLALSADVTATTPVSKETLFIAVARFDKFVGVTSAEIATGTRLPASRSKETTPVD